MPSITPPEAGHRLAIAGETVDYRLRRSPRRTIGLSIDQRGLRVAAPLRARLGDIEQLIREHGDWVLNKLANWRERPPAAKLEIKDGTVIDVLGQPLTVTVTAIGRARWQFVDDKLHLWTTATANANQILEKALRDRARQVFAERLALYAPQLDLTAPPLRISSARTRWGSCSHHGGISLNWRLLLMPLPLLDYVVCHELAHLREMNHSPRFWSVVETLCPDWKNRRQELRAQGRLLARF